VSLHSSSFCNLASFLFFSLNINLKIYYDPRVWHNPWLISKVSKNIVAIVGPISKSWPPKLKATSLYSNFSSQPLHVWTLPYYFWFFKFVLSFLSYVFHLCVCFLLWVQRVEFKVINGVYIYLSSCFGLCVLALLLQVFQDGYIPFLASWCCCFFKMIQFIFLLSWWCCIFQDDHIPLRLAS
jgi:hypothetical protein